VAERGLGPELGGRGVGESSIAFSVLSENPAIRRDENKFATIVSISPRRSKPGLSTEGEANAYVKRRAPAPGTRPCLSSRCFAQRSTLLSFPCMLVLSRQSIRHFPA